jgi:predicted TIM-barrel fold metal-dependent hydrolase
MVGIGHSIDRRPQADAPSYPTGTLVVSADSHWLEGDIWIDRVPAHLRDRAPRVLFEDGGYQLYVNGRRVTDLTTAEEACVFEGVPGARDVGSRLADLDVEGVAAEVLFPQKFFHLQFVKDLELREWCVRGYNQHLAEVGAQAPGRLLGVGILPWWDQGLARDALAELGELGFRAIMIPMNPGLDAGGEPVDYTAERMDPFWSAIEASGLPLCFHIGEKFGPTSGRGRTGSETMRQIGGLRNIWATITFGGVFERCPDLRVVFAEGGLHWVPGALQEADMIHESYPGLVRPRLPRPPSHYWHTNCYATFMVDPIGLSLLDRIGADRALWSTDYPHNEGTLGYTRSAVHAVFAATDEECAKRIVGGNAVELFGLTGLDRFRT